MCPKVLEFEERGENRESSSGVREKKLPSHATSRPPMSRKVGGVGTQERQGVFESRNRRGLHEMDWIWRGRAVKIDMARGFRKGVEMCRSVRG